MNRNSEPQPEVGRYRVETWGCQMNTHDSEKLAGLLEEMGYRPADSAAEADVILLNTCSIREKASEKLFSHLGTLRRLKSLRPSLIIGVCGCVAQQDGKGIFGRSDLVDLVMGPRAIASLPTMLEEVRSRRSRVMDLGRRDDSIRFEGARARRAGGPRAYLTIMEGCNKACTYCIVPNTRGREISKPANQVLEEAEALSRAGYREVELLGQNVNAYRHEGVHLDGLLRRLQRFESIRRVRFTTSHPAHLSQDIIRAMRDCPTVCNHLHLPAQSGSDSVLERMKRGYHRRRYLDRIEKLFAHVPDISLSTDIIVGFPGETRADFEASMSLLEEVPFDQVYAFIYSPRPGTEALGLGDETPMEEKRSRLKELQTRQQEQQKNRNQCLVGQDLELLVDGYSRPGQLKGRTRTNRVVNFEGAAELIGEFVRIRVEKAGANGLEGRCLSTPDLDLPRAAVYK